MENNWQIAHDEMKTVTEQAKRANRLIMVYVIFL